jgi:hypothetical protein
MCQLEQARRHAIQDLLDYIDELQERCEGYMRLEAAVNPMLVVDLQQAAYILKEAGNEWFARDLRRHAERIVEALER